MEIKIKLDPNGKMPERKTEGAACYDCYANLEEPVTIFPHHTAVIPLGFKTEFEDGYYIEVRGRSGNATRGIWINIGTVDSDYRGTVGAITLNASSSPVVINNGDRIAQILVKEIVSSELKEVSELSETERGDGGFGHTGK